MQFANKSSVPHGGYSTATLCNTVRMHMKLNHPRQHNGFARPVAMQLSFLRQTNVGSARIEIQDVKLGSRISVLHVSLSQISPKGEETLRIMGYMTVSDRVSEAGISSALCPKPQFIPPPSLPLSLNAQGPGWRKVEIPYPDFRRAARQTEFYAFEDVRDEWAIVRQWARFRPGGKEGRWTNASVPYLIDLFPITLARMEVMANAEVRREDTAAGRNTNESTPFWFPTLALQADYRKELPEEGVEWLYSQVVLRTLEKGRTIIDVTMMDEAGDSVAVAVQTGLVMAGARNLKTASSVRL